MKSSPTRCNLAQAVSAHRKGGQLAQGCLGGTCTGCTKDSGRDFQTCDLSKGKSEEWKSHQTLTVILAADASVLHTLPSLSRP